MSEFNSYFEFTDLSRSLIVLSTVSTIDPNIIPMHTLRAPSWRDPPFQVILVAHLCRIGSADVTLFNPPESDSEGDTRTFSIASSPFENQFCKRAS